MGRPKYLGFEDLVKLVEDATGWTIVEITQGDGLYDWEQLQFRLKRAARAGGEHRNGDLIVDMKCSNLVEIDLHKRIANDVARGLESIGEGLQPVESK